MRITNNMIARGMLSNVNAHLRRMEDLHHQMSSGSRLRVPSDDPAAVATSMRLQTNLVHTKQHRENVGAALSWLGATDATLNEALEGLHRAKELGVYGASSSMPQEARDALADEVDQILDHMIDLGNTSHAGLYLFAGNATLTTPFAENPNNVPGEPVLAPEYMGDDGERVYEIGGGVTIAVNIPGEETFMPIFDALVQMRDALYAGDLDTVGGDAMADMDAALDGLLRTRSDAGARVNRLELASARLHELELNVEQLIHDTEATDMAQAITELKVSENAYRAALASGARIIQPTLMDFLR